jgi:hypothetical protein
MDFLMPGILRAEPAQTNAPVAVMTAPLELAAVR